MIRCLIFKNSQIFKKGKNQIKKEFFNKKLKTFNDGKVLT